MLTKEIAAAIGRGTGLPSRSVTAEEIPGCFAFPAALLVLDDWEPTYPGLIADYDAGHYFA